MIRFNLGKVLSAFFLISVLVLCPMTTQAGTIDPKTPSGQQPKGSSGWTLDFSDEFAGSSLDTTKWNACKMGRGQETTHWAWSCWNPDNISFDGNNMVFKFSSWWGTRTTDEWKRNVSSEAETYFDSGAISSSGKYERKYGFFECNILPPAGGNQCQSSFWLFANGMNTVGDDANDGAEIDIVETNKNSNQYATNVHWDGYGSSHKSDCVYVSTSSNPTEGWHRYGLEWSATSMKFYYDGAVKRTVTNVSRIPDVNEYIFVASDVLGWDEGNIWNATLPLYGKYSDVRVWYK